MTRPAELKSHQHLCQCIHCVIYRRENKDALAKSRKRKVDQFEDWWEREGKHVPSACDPNNAYQHNVLLKTHARYVWEAARSEQDKQV